MQKLQILDFQHQLKVEMEVASYTLHLAPNATWLLRFTENSHTRVMWLISSHLELSSLFYMLDIPHSQLQCLKILTTNFWPQTAQIFSGKPTLHARLKAFSPNPSRTLSQICSNFSLTNVYLWLTLLVTNGCRNPLPHTNKLRKSSLNVTIVLRLSKRHQMRKKPLLKLFTTKAKLVAWEEVKTSKAKFLWVVIWLKKNQKSKTFLAFSAQHSSREWTRTHCSSVLTSLNTCLNSWSENLVTRISHQKCFITKVNLSTRISVSKLMKRRKHSFQKLNVKSRSNLCKWTKRNFALSSVALVEILCTSTSNLRS